MQRFQRWRLLVARPRVARRTRNRWAECLSSFQDDGLNKFRRADTTDGGLVLHLQLSSFVDLLSFLGEFRGEAVPLESAHSD